MNDAELPDNGKSDADEAAFDDGSTDWVRDLLADARVTGPIPADVAARLDDTVASLQAERRREASHEPAAAVVVPLWRRLAPRLAAAAVVVVIGGVAIGQVVRGSSVGGNNAASSDSGSRASSGSALPPGSPGASGLEKAPQALKDSTSALPELSVGTFGQDAARVMRGLSDAAVGTSASVPSSGGSDDNFDQVNPKAAAPPVTATPEPDALAAGRPSCRGPETTDAVTLPATLDGTLVALVFRRPTATAQEVEAWSCDGATMLAAASVPR